MMTEVDARYVIRAVGSRMGGGDEVRKLGNATIKNLKLADENNIGSLAFPAISAGVFGFPQASCARIILEAVYRYLPGSTGIKKIVFAFFDSYSFEAFKKEVKSPLTH